ncbi:MAG: S1C family serine protease [Halolamina sp.]
MDSSRRRFLAAVGAAATSAVAGCSAETLGVADAESPSEKSAADAATGESSFADVYDRVAPSVVLVRTYGPRGPSGQGSGWMYDDGVVVTNDHVVADADTVRVQFRNGDWTEAEPLGTDPYSDLAALSVPSAPSAATPLSTVDSDPDIGAEVAVIGSPFGLGGSLTTGVVSGLDRSIRGPNEFSIPDAIQTDAALNPGNSGGPLVDLDGLVVGVVSQGGGENVGFAISAALVERVIPALVETGSYQHSYMGVGISPVTPLLAEANDLDRAAGVYVGRVREGSPSDGVLRGSTGTETVEGTEISVGGDVIRALDDAEVRTLADLSTYLALNTGPGDTVAVTVLRDGEEQVVDLELGTRPDPNR